MWLQFDIYIKILITYSIALNIKEYCEQNHIIVVQNAFRVDNVFVLFLQNNDQTTKVYKIKGMIFTEEETSSKKMSFRSIDEWQTWNHHKNGTVIEELNDFITSFRLIYADKSAPIIFVKQSSDKKSLIGFEVQFDRSVNHIESIRKFTVDAYRSHNDDHINLRDFYLNFPLQTETLAKPIVSVPVYASFPQRSLVYYEEKNQNENIYKIHIIREQKYSNGTIGWIADKESGECFDLDEQITAAVSIGDLNYRYRQANNRYDIYFNVLEFDTSESFRIRKISFETNGKIKSESFDKPIGKIDAREHLICKAPVILPDTSTTITNDMVTPSVSNGVITTTDTKQPKQSKRKTNGWVYVILVIFFILIIIAIVSAIYWYTQRKHINEPTKSETVDQKTEDQEMRDIGSQTEQTKKTDTKALDQTETTDKQTLSTTTQPTESSEQKSSEGMAPIQSTNETDL